MDSVDFADLDLLVGAIDDDFWVAMRRVRVWKVNLADDADDIMYSFSEDSDPA